MTPKKDIIKDFMVSGEFVAAPGEKEDSSQMVLICTMNSGRKVTISAHGIIDIRDVRMGEAALPIERQPYHYMSWDEILMFLDEERAQVALASLSA